MRSHSIDLLACRHLTCLCSIQVAMSSSFFFFSVVAEATRHQNASKQTADSEALRDCAALRGTLGSSQAAARFLCEIQVGTLLCYFLLTNMTMGTQAVAATDVKHESIFSQWGYIFWCRNDGSSTDDRVSAHKLCSPS